MLAQCESNGSSVQIGSYFGGVLQTVDVDSDSYTDLLLVGAPMYMGSERNEQGQVYVYKLNKVWSGEGVCRMRLLAFVSLCFPSLHHY